MHISKVELENFKSHADSTFEFGRGTIWFRGPNGAGKTSIIEAIAWTIFDTLDYKKEDIIRRGTKKGSARVTFESGLDEREYTVYRDTGNGYYVYDPRLKMRIADKKDDVKRFLWQHLGIEPGTDLELLFRHAIGVPQGTFTSIFIATAGERKRTFDGLLKVEEYRRSSDELLKTVRFVEQAINAVNVAIARAEGELAGIDTIEAERTKIANEAADWTARLQELNGLVNDLKATVAKLDGVEARLTELQADASRSRSESSRQKLVLEHAEAEVLLCRKAATIVEQVQVDAEAHRQSLARIKELELERQERQRFAGVLANTENLLIASRAEKKHLLEDLEKIEKSRVEVGELRGHAKRQEELEANLSAARSELAVSERADGRLKDIEDRLAALREAYRTVSASLAETVEKAKGASEIAVLEGRDAQIGRELARTNAALERDERFQKEVKNGLCPILSAKCLNLKEGETLEGFISSQFDELRSRISNLQAEQKDSANALKAARDAALSGAQVPVLEDRLAAVRKEGETLKSQKVEVDAVAQKLPALKENVARIEATLKELNDPIARLRILERESSRESSVRDRISLCEQEIGRLESEQTTAAEKLEAYKELDMHFENARRLNETTAKAFHTFLAHEAAAGQAAKKEAEFATAQTEYKNAEEVARAAEKAAESIAAGYDRDLHAAQRNALLDGQRRQAEASVMADSLDRRLSELAAEAERLYEVRRSMQNEFRERERLKKVSETTEFIRSTLREAAPLVAKNYVHHVSLEANQLFREIRGDAECTLKWMEDYGIVLEEAGYERPFQSLSGGEQMAAALSVRLALLKQLSDIHLAFFDEPTTNMDAERRENLAMQIGNISHFDQLFVVSHDDTFEGYMDHEIQVPAEIAMAETNRADL